MPKRKSCLAISKRQYYRRVNTTKTVTTLISDDKLCSIGFCSLDDDDDHHHHHGDAELPSETVINEVSSSEYSDSDDNLQDFNLCSGVGATNNLLSSHSGSSVNNYQNTSFLQTKSEDLKSFAGKLRECALHHNVSHAFLNDLLPFATKAFVFYQNHSTKCKNFFENSC